MAAKFDYDHLEQYDKAELQAELDRRMKEVEKMREMRARLSYQVPALRYAISKAPDVDVEEMLK